MQTANALPYCMKQWVYSEKDIGKLHLNRG